VTGDSWKVKWEFGIQSIPSKQRCGEVGVQQVVVIVVIAGGGMLLRRRQQWAGALWPGVEGEGCPCARLGCGVFADVGCRSDASGRG